jgi:hypothetical protein
MHIQLKFNILLCFAASIASNLWADNGHREIAYVQSATVDGFSIGLTDEFGYTNSRPSLRLCFTVWTTDGPTGIAFPTQPEYAYEIELLDSNGLGVTKTELGKVAGSRFNNFNISTFQDIKVQRTTANKRDQLSDMLLIFRPSDLFIINKPGHYTLRVRFQIAAFPKTGPNQADYGRIVIRFPSLNFPLVQPLP